MRAWLEINLEAVWQNVGVVKDEVGRDVDIIAVVKSDAYGSGLEPIVRTIDAGPVGMYAVISLEEARRIRSISAKPILIMSYLDTKEVVDAIEEEFIVSVYDKELFAVYERFAARLNKQLKIHVKVETGLNRLGVGFDDAVDFITNQRLFPHLSMEAVFSHLAFAADPVKSGEQLRILQRLLVEVGAKAPVFPIHLASSYALGSFKPGYLDAVRVGLALHGTDAILPNLKPSVSCKSVIMQIKEVQVGEGVSYNHLFIAKKPTTVAVIPIGYAEGLSQTLQGVLTVLVEGHERPVLGWICMNMVMVDVTGLPVKRGDEVVLIGSQKGKDGQSATIAVADLAKRSSIRHHEIIVRLGQGLPRRYHEIKPRVINNG